MKTVDDRTHCVRNRCSTMLVALLLTAVMVRIAVVVVLSDDLRTDPDGYVGLAESLAAGEGLTVPGSNQSTAFRPPLLPLLLAAAMMLGMSKTLAMAVVNIAAGIVTVAATWMLGRAVRLEERWLVAVAAITVLDPLLLRYTALPMTEVLSAALLTLGMWMFVRYQTENAVRFGTAAGIVFGVGALCRPTLLITGLLVSACGGWCRLREVLLAAAQFDSPTPALSREPESFSHDRRRCHAVRNSMLRTLITAAVPVAAMILPLAPWIVRNERQFDTLIPATTHGGYTLLLGNNSVFYREVVEAPGQPVWSGDSLAAWQNEINDEMLGMDVEAGDEVLADRWMYNRAKFAIRAEPRTFLKACVLRWKRFWSLIPAADSGNFGKATEGAVGTWYGILWIGLLGSVVLPGVRRRTPCLSLLWMAILSFLLLHTFYWTNTRMRAPLTGVIAVLTVAGWQQWLTILQGWFIPASPHSS